MDEYDQAVRALPVWLARPLLELPITIAETIHEIRLRSGCPIYFTVNGAQLRPEALPQCPKSLCGMRLTQLQMEEILYTICGGSVHTHQAELAAGYVTIAGGCRVGVGGQYLRHLEQGVLLQEVRSLNLRIAREKRIALPAQLCCALREHFIGLLIVGEPDSGKTTLLREIARTLAVQGRAVTVIDERRELFPKRESPAEAEAPPLDVLSGLPKGQALEMALRTLSPKVILLDELGGMAEITALEQGFFSGVDFIASLHASSLEEAARRPQVRYLKQHEMLRGTVLLEGSHASGKIKEVRFS